MYEYIGLIVVVYVFVMHGLYYFYKKNGRDVGSAKGGIKSSGIWRELGKDFLRWYRRVRGYCIKCLGGLKNNN